MRTTSPRFGSAALLLATSLMFQGGHRAAAETLITPAEAALPAAGSPVVLRGITRGPTILLIQPRDGHAPAGRPVAFQVRFEAHNGAEIDLASVKITYLKNPEVDLTRRLTPYITQQGIAMADAEFPRGIHPIRIDVKDSEGRESTVALTLTIGP